MPTPDELLAKLEERLILGEVSEETYKELKARLLSRKAESQAGERGMEISDVVIGGDVSNTTGRASVGAIRVNVPGPGSEAGSQEQVVACSICGRKNELRDTFKCVACGRDYLCASHLVTTAKRCEECAAEDRRLRDEARLKREREKTKRDWAAGAPDAYANSIDMKLKLIQSGTFVMGSDSASGYRGTAIHEVRITKAFYLGACPVTQHQYEAVMGANPSQFRGPRRPVESISWDDAEEFCRRLSDKEALTYRLPTESEWEYACRAGSRADYCFGDSEDELIDYTAYA